MGNNVAKRICDPLFDAAATRWLKELKDIPRCVDVSFL
jgi:hypothetical protein